MFTCEPEGEAGGVRLLLSVDTWPANELAHHSVECPGQNWAVQKEQIDHLGSHATRRSCQISYASQRAATQALL